MSKLEQKAREVTDRVMDPRGDGDHAVQPEEIAAAIVDVARWWLRERGRILFDYGEGAESASEAGEPWDSDKAFTEALAAAERDE